MIVFGDSFLVSAPAAAPALVNPRIGWQNYLFDLAAADLTVSGETAAGPRDALLTPDTAEYWEPDALPAWIIVDLGQARTVNYVGLVGNFGAVRASVKVELSTEPSFTTGATTLGDEVAPADDAPLLFLDNDLFGRWLRVTVNGTLPPRIPVLYAGSILAMAKAVSGTYRPISIARKTVLRRTLSRDGQFLGQGFRRNGVQSEVAFKNLDYDWVLANFDAFSQHARARPYFFAWNPQEFPAQVGFVWTEADIVPQFNGNGHDMDVGFGMVGVGASAGA